MEHGHEIWNLNKHGTRKMTLGNEKRRQSRFDRIARLSIPGEMSPPLDVRKSNIKQISKEIDQVEQERGGGDVGRGKKLVGQSSLV